MHSAGASPRKQYPKKTRGAGAAPRDPSKGQLWVQMDIFDIFISNIDKEIYEKKNRPRPKDGKDNGTQRPEQNKASETPISTNRP